MYYVRIILTYKYHTVRYCSLFKKIILLFEVWVYWFAFTFCLSCVCACCFCVCCLCAKLNLVPCVILPWYRAKEEIKIDRLSNTVPGYVRYQPGGYYSINNRSNMIQYSTTGYCSATVCTTLLRTSRHLTSSACSAAHLGKKCPWIPNDIEWLHSFSQYSVACIVMVLASSSRR